MRLRVTDYRHPAEPPALVAAVWSAATLVLLAEAVPVWLLIVRPLGAYVAVPVGVGLLALFNVGALAGILRIREHRSRLRDAARTAGPTRHARLHQAAERAAERLSAPGTPPIHVLPLDEPDSFTIGWGRPEIFVTEGLLDELGDLELQAAMAHELAQLKGGHARLLTPVLLPLRARLVHPVLAVPFALAWLALRWWARIAELSADRAAAVAVGGAEPVAHWLSTLAAADAGARALPPDSLDRYMTYGAHEDGWELIEAELHHAHRSLGRRITEVVTFTHSRRFANCLAIVGDLDVPVVGDAPDPASPGVIPHVVIGMLAGLWLAPLTIAITVVLGAPQEPAATPVGEPGARPAQQFDPQAPPPTEDAVLPEPLPPDEAAADDEAPEPGDEPPAEGEPAAGEGDQAAPVDETVQGMLEVARIHKEREEYEKAERVLQDLLLRDPTVAEAHYLLGWVKVAQGDNESAVQEFTATANLTAEGSEMHGEAVSALERLGQ